jgi:biotin operon repressor
MEKIFRVRDLRKKSQFIIDDEYLNGYAKIVSPYATLVYISLCRHADKEQKCWPSLDKLAEEFSMSRDSALKGIKELEKLNIIVRRRLGKRLCNEYWLIDKSEWVKSTIATSPEVDHSHKVKSTSATSEVDVVDSKDTQEKDTHKKDIVLTNVRTSNTTNKVITLFKSINPSYKRLFSNKTQRAAVERLLDQYGIGKLEKIINTLPEILGSQYAPTITTPLMLEEKMGQFLIFIKKEQDKQIENKIII